MEKSEKTQQHKDEEKVKQDPGVSPEDYDSETQNPGQEVQIDKESEAELEKAVAELASHELKKEEEEAIVKKNLDTKEDKLAMNLIGATNDVEFSQKKLQIVESGDFARMCLTDRSSETQEKSRGQILKRKDGKHYAFKDEYTKEALGRIEYTRSDVISMQRWAVGGLVKKIGKGLLNGKVIMNISFPIEVFEPKSELERAAAQYGFAPHFLDKAAQLTDPVEQMKLVMAFAVARLHMMVEQRKPFNPILGETYQGYVDGSPFYFEQIEHHPPIYASQFLGKGYTIEGTHEATGRIAINTFYGAFIGLEKLTFHNTGNTLYIRNPSGVLEGVLYGKRLTYFHHTLRILDPKNKLAGRLKFNPDRTTLYNVFNKRKWNFDAFFGGIYEVKDSFVQDRMADIKKHYKAHVKTKPGDIVKTICEANGNACDKCVIDGKEYWTFNQYVPYRLTEVPNPLPSDATYRLDSLYLLQGDLKKAQEKKDDMENLQRKDRKLRAELGPAKGHGHGGGDKPGEEKKKKGFFSNLFSKK